MNKNEGEKPRNLEEVCEGGGDNFSTELNGHIYCTLGMTKGIGCRWQDKKKDKNGCYVCLKYCKNMPDYE